MFDEGVRMSGVNVINCEARVDGLQSAFRMAVDAMDRGLFSAVSVVSPQRQLALGCNLNGTPCTISMVSTMSARLKAWMINWSSTKEALERLSAEVKNSCVGLKVSDAVGYANWWADDLVEDLFGRGSSVLHVWDLGTDDDFLPCIRGEAKRRNICILAVKSDTHAVVEDDVLPNLQEIPVYERCLALIRTRKMISTSLLQRAFRLGYNEATRLIERLKVEGVVREPKEGAGVLEIVWERMSKGPKLALQIEAS